MTSNHDEITKEVKRSILSLTFDELKQIVLTNSYPDNVTLEGIETREDYEKLFKHRNSPALLAKNLIVKDANLKERQHGEPEDIKRKRLELREAEIEAKKVKSVAQTQAFEQILNTLRRIETGIDYLVQNLKSKKEIQHGRK